MNNILYILAFILLITWAIGFLGYGSGPIIHLLLVISIISLLMRLIIWDAKR